MITIAATLDLEGFKKAYNSESVVKKLSDDGVAFCFEVVASLQANQTTPTSINWRDVFDSANEVTSEQLIDRYSDTILHYNGEIIAMTEELPVDKKITSILNDTELSNIAKVRNNLSDLMLIPEFVEGLATILARDYWWHSLNNGLWLKT